MATKIRYLTVGSYSTLDPALLGIDEKATSIHVPRGCYPGSAWVCMAREDIDDIDRDAEHTLKWYDYDEGGRAASTSFKGYYLKQAVATHPDGDGKAAYLVEFQDKRALLWQSPPCDKRFNVVRPIPIYVADGAHDSDKYHSDSLSSGSLYTWATAWTALWAMLPAAIAGTKPTLPYTPGGKPKHLAHWKNAGASSWQACCEFLALIGCDIIYKHETGTFDVCRLGTTQSTGTPDRSLTPLVDWKPKTDMNALQPEKVQVCFPKLTPAHDPALQTPHIETPSDTIDGTITGTKLVIWDTTPAYDFPVGTIANLAAEITARGIEVATNARNRITVSERPSRKEYSGIITAVCGSQISDLLFRDYGDEDGCRTEVVCRKGPLLLPGPQRIQAARTWLGKAASQITKSTSGTVRYWMGTTGQTDSGVNVTGVYSRMDDAPATKFLGIEWENDQWEVGKHEC